MGNLRLYGSTSGYVEIAPPAVAGTTVLTLPTDSVQPGIVLVSSNSFSAAASVSLNNCFSGTYDNYRVMIRATCSNGQDLDFRLRLSGTDATSAYSRQAFAAYSGASTLAWQETSQAAARLVTVNNVSGGWASIDIYSPFIATPTAFISTSSKDNSSANAIDIFGALHATATAYDGLTVLPNPTQGGTMTGSIRIYGYRN